jgi:hypothetical protein
LVAGEIICRKPVSRTHKKENPAEAGFSRGTTGRRDLAHTQGWRFSGTNGERKLMVASLRYLDTFAKGDGAWLFAERKLYVDWTETRSSHP